eukprot:s1825_g16.t1
MDSILCAFASEHSKMLEGLDEEPSTALLFAAQARVFFRFAQVSAVTGLDTNFVSNGLPPGDLCKTTKVGLNADEEGAVEADRFKKIWAEQEEEEKKAVVETRVLAEERLKADEYMAIQQAGRMSPFLGVVMPPEGKAEAPKVEDGCAATSPPPKLKHVELPPETAPPEGAEASSRIAKKWQDKGPETGRPRKERNATGATGATGAAGRSYDFFVEARAAAVVGPESWTPLLTAFAASKPSAPQNFAIDLQSLSTGLAILSWTAPASNGSSSITGYRVQPRKVWPGAFLTQCSLLDALSSLELLGRDERSDMEKYMRAVRARQGTANRNYQKVQRFWEGRGKCFRMLQQANGPLSRPPRREPESREAWPGAYPKSNVSLRMDEGGATGVKWPKPASEEGKPTTPEAGSPGRSDPARFALGATSGRFAAGAWAARVEVVDLLESRCDPNQLVSLIKAGDEGSEALIMRGTPNSPSNRSPLKRKGRSLSYSPSIGESPKGEPLWDPSASNDTELGLQKALLESLNQADRSTPDWVSGLPGPQAVRTQAAGELCTSAEYVFAKKAEPPAQDAEILGGGSSSHRPVSPELAPEPTGDGDSLSFGKRAEPPKEGQTTAPNVESLLGSSMTLGRGKSDIRSMKDREDVEMEKFHSMSLELYKTLKELGVVMELRQLVEKSGSINEMRFRLHTSPNRAATGLRYARVMKNMFDYAADKDAADPEQEGFLGKVPVIEYVEHLIQSGAGYRTPQAVLYSMDFFSKAFGFELRLGTLERVRRLALRYAQSKPDHVSRADSFSKEFMLFLEKAVLDPLYPKTLRTVCGKLQLCIQGSVRYDDLLNTPLADFEWARRRGEAHVVAIRSKALRGKSGARLWVASVMGVAPEHDMWLAQLVELLIESHGSDWESHDHTGRAVSKDDVSFQHCPSTLEGDVGFLKEKLMELKRGGTDVGLTSEEILTLRWHGAKSTLTTLMQHLQCPDRMVRLAGGWKSSAEAMPDVYLREIQMMTLEGQERCLTHLRGGGTMGGLEGERIGRGFPGAFPRSKDESEGAVDARHGEEFVGLDPRCCAEALLDDLFRGKEPEVGDLVHEMDAQLPHEVLSPYVEKIEAVLEAETSPLEVKQEVEDDAREGGEKNEGDLNKAEDEDREDDSEFLVTSFVTVSLPNQKSKLHMAARDSTLLTQAIPRCRANGSFSHLAAGETLDARMELCRRCFGLRDKDACRHLCEFRVTDPDGTGRRCGRPCASSQEGHGSHACLLHELD